MIDLMFDEVVEIVEAKLPRHDCSLTLCHNEHRDYYLTCEQAEAEAVARHGPATWSWVSPEQRAKALETNDYWSIQWYPDTPIGSYKVYAADLSALLEYVETLDVRG